jgi:hypothetical protein
MSHLEISVKSGKDSTSTMSLVIHRVRFNKNLQNTTIVFIQESAENHQF